MEDNILLCKTFVLDNLWSVMLLLSTVLLSELQRDKQQPIS